MMTTTTFISILVFTCIAGNAFGQDATDPLEEEYITKCHDLHTNMNRSDVKVYLWESYFCTWYCSGFDGENFFFDPIPKGADAECTPLIIANSNGPQENYQCLLNECERQSDVEECNSALENEQVTSLEDDECKLTCQGSANTSITMNKKAGSSCTIERTYGKKTECNQVGVCVAKQDYVPLPSGAFDASAAAATATCIQRNTGDKDMQLIMFDPSCEFICLYSNQTGEMTFEYLTFPDGTTTEDDQVCVAGKSMPAEVFDSCQEHTKRVDVEECKVTCWGDEDATYTQMPEDTVCTGEDGEGTCDSNGECIVPSNEYEDSEEK